MPFLVASLVAVLMTAPGALLVVLLIAALLPWFDVPAVPFLMALLLLALLVPSLAALLVASWQWWHPRTLCPWRQLVSAVVSPPGTPLMVSLVRVLLPAPPLVAAAAPVCAAVPSPAVPGAAAAIARSGSSRAPGGAVGPSGASRERK